MVRGAGGVRSKEGGVSRGIAGFGHVTIVVTDLAAAKRFYGETLGLPEAKRPDWTAPGAWYRVGSAQLHVQVKPDYVAPPYDVGPHFAVYAPSERYHRTIADLEAAGVRFHVPPHQDASDGQWRAFCKDPAGNNVEVTDHDPTGL
jgi:catechol 2,3-dioxygenase-like lactoylglutathione lyase family enzyme